MVTVLAGNAKHVQYYELFSFFNEITSIFLHQEIYVICALSVLCTWCQYAAATTSCQH